MLHKILFEQLEKLMMLMIDHGLQTDGDVGDDEKKCYNLQLAGQPVHGLRASRDIDVVDAE